MSGAGSTGAVRDVLAAFLEDFADRLSTHRLEAVLAGESDDLTSSDLGNRPESITESKLVFPLLGAVGLDHDPHPYGAAGDRGAWPDFELTDLDVRAIGESKKLNCVDEAIPEVRDYLDRKSIGADYGVATDGIEWYVYKIELGGDFTEYPEIDHVDLRPALLALARDRGLVDASGLTGVDVDEVLAEFVELFERDAFEELLSRTAPRMLREERKRDVEAFYDLYIELLFGEGEAFDYDTCLLDDVQSPPGATTHDEQLFGITLLNRLLFVRFLETRGVLDEGFLRERVQHYEEHGHKLTGNLYESQIKPLFYDLLNTPKGPKRKPKHRQKGSWFADVPYLNGGLFRENIPDEQRYGVYDRILEDVVDDLIEGSRLELDGRGFDPAIVGSVFEKTINHVEQERTQKDVGAYYTPNDVTEIVVEGSVDPKIKDVLVEAFVEAVADDDEDRRIVRSRMDGMELPELLRQVEEGEGWFGDAGAVRAAKERLGELTVLDPACGSGHFLTTAMDEIHRAQVALMRGLNYGEDPDDEELYAAKETLALDCIYGVDVDEVAVEIAKLRVWLKIVEGNGWEEQFGRLPNIDVNITDGNSLVGLPMTGSFDDVDVWSERIQEIEERRLEYKAADAGDPRELERFMAEEIRPELDERYLQLFSRPVETEMETVDEFDGVVGSVETGNLYPTVSSVQARRADGEAITDDQAARLEELGFSVYTKSARLDVQDREANLKAQDDVDHWAVLTDGLRGLLADGFVFSEVERRPTAYDLDRVLGTPFHWVAEFPEVAGETGNGGRRTINFDIVLANPPYGDLLSDEERLFTTTFETEGFNEVSANFVERELRLLGDGGYLGNVTTLRLVHQSTMEPFHDLLRDALTGTRIANFGFRPSRVFEAAHITVSLITGRKDTGSRGGIQTSGLLLFNEENRQERLTDIEYSTTEGFVLRDRIGGTEGRRAILPKIGPPVKKAILRRLKEQSGTTFADRFSREEAGSGHPVWRREGVLYWINPMLEELYDAREVKPMYFSSELERKTAFLVLNSSLYYVYWMTYGNQHHHNWTQLEAFPFPDDERMERREEEILELADVIWTRMKGTFSKSRDGRGDFFMGSLRPVVDDVDGLVGELYGLSADQVAYTKRYLRDLGEGSGRAGTGDGDLVEHEPVFETES